MSPLLLLFASPSLAFEISPVMSKIRLGLSSCGLIGRLLSFWVRSLTVWSRFRFSKSFFSSVSDPIVIHIKVNHYYFKSKPTDHETHAETRENLYQMRHSNATYHSPANYPCHPNRIAIHLCCLSDQSR